MKAILKFETPETCIDCPCFQGQDILNSYCGVKKLIIPFKEQTGWEIPIWCPLKRLEK
jgi:hypothetical protein